MILEWKLWAFATEALPVNLYVNEVKESLGHRFLNKQALSNPLDIKWRVASEMRLTNSHGLIAST